MDLGLGTSTLESDSKVDRPNPRQIKAHVTHPRKTDLFQKTSKVDVPALECVSKVIPRWLFHIQGSPEHSKAEGADPRSEPQSNVGSTNAAVALERKTPEAIRVPSVWPSRGRKRVYGLIQLSQLYVGV